MLMWAAEKTETFYDPSSGLTSTFIQRVDFCIYQLRKQGSERSTLQMRQEKTCLLRCRLLLPLRKFLKCYWLTTAIKRDIAISSWKVFPKRQ